MISNTLIVVVVVIGLGFLLLFAFSMPLYHLAMRAQQKALEMQRKYTEQQISRSQVGGKQ